MSTEVFKSYKDFLSREDKSVNGVSEEYASSHNDYERDNISNDGCWNCLHCVNCIDCLGCQRCTRLTGVSGYWDLLTTKIDNHLFTMVTRTHTAREKIKQLRILMLSHSYLYYKLDNPTVSDHKWQEWADNLVTLHDKYGTSIGFYDDVFLDWRGDTGCHLPVDDDVVRWAYWAQQR